MIASSDGQDVARLLVLGISRHNPLCLNLLHVETKLGNQGVQEEVFLELLGH